MPGWARSFGAQANITYIDAKAKIPLFCPEFVDPPAAELAVRPESHAEHGTDSRRVQVDYNLVGMYERGPLSARLSYNHRSRYPEGELSQRREGRETIRPYTLQGRGRSSGVSTWSTNYNLTDKFTLFFDWTNILNNPFRSDIVRVNYAKAASRPAAKMFPMVVRYKELVMTAGVRFRFGGTRSRPAAAPVLPSFRRRRRRWSNRRRWLRPRRRRQRRSKAANAAKLEAWQDMRAALCGAALFLWLDQRRHALGRIVTRADFSASEARRDLRLAVLPEQRRDVEVALVVRLAAAAGRGPRVEAMKVRAPTLKML